MWEDLAKWASFETEGLVLRPFTFKDREDLFVILSDSETRRFIYPQVISPETCQTLLVQVFMRQPLGIWAIVDKDKDCLIGAIRLENINQKKKRAEIGYFLSKHKWRQGVMTEALESLVYLGFKHLGMTELIIKTHEENLASQKLAEKSGFSLYRSYKGSDRYSHRTRAYRDYHYLAKDYKGPKWSDIRADDC